MGKKCRAQLLLERVEMCDTIIQNKLIEQQQWRDLADSITANMDCERVQSSGSQSKMADAVTRCLDMVEEIAEAVDRLIAEKQKVVKTIEKLYSPTEYKLLHLHYVQYMGLADIADSFGKGYSWATTTHGRALKSVEKILDKPSTKKNVTTGDYIV